MELDALATGICVLGERNGLPLLERRDIEAVFISNDGEASDSDCCFYPVPGPVYHGVFISAGFIPASNEPSGHACMRIWRLPRGSNTPLLCSATNLMPRCSGVFDLSEILLYKSLRYFRCLLHVLLV